MTEKLTPEEKKIVWSGPESNLGLGWTVKTAWVEPDTEEPYDEETGMPPEVDLDQ